METQRFEEQLQSLPDKPGVYLMKDDGGNILYVGKAANLRHRVRSYFGPDVNQSLKLSQMMQRVGDFEFIVTASEQEALILECTLIKRHRPRYNVRLKDDKNYPYLKINLNEDWPRVYITRRIEQDGARYFGPYASAKSVRKVLDLLMRLFPYRSCTKNITGTDPRPCLDYHMNRCLGPCIGEVSKEEYDETIRQVILFLEGKQTEVVSDLRRQMEEAAEKLNFERAAVLRDHLRAIERVLESQTVVSTTRGDEDVVAFAQDKTEACVEIFYVRGGKVIGREHFVLEGTRDEAPGQIMASFIKQFYSSATFIPPEILLQAAPEELPVLEEWLQTRRGKKVKLQVPRRGEKRKLVQLVAQNAEQDLQQLRLKWLADRGKTSAAMEELQEQLNLPRLPKRIECYDISDIRGTSAVGSMVVFENGRPKSAHYRRFKIKTVASADDYAMMQEVLRRRFKRGVGAPTKSGRKESEGGKTEAWGITPDLVLIDGGQGHLNAALEVMRELEVIDFVPVASLAKEKEEVFLPDMSESVILPRDSQALYLLQRVRDEAHRFALSYHQKLRQTRAISSAIDAVPGIGPKRKRALLRKFGSLKAIKEAPVDDIAAVVGMTRSLAEKVKEYL